MAQLTAGVARVTLTPAIGAWLVGFAGRESGSTGMLDDLYATALVLRDTDTTVAIVSCDLIAVHPDLVVHIRALTEEATGIPGANVMICCTHTHSGPPGYALEGSRPIDRAYVAHLPFLIAGAIRLAWQRQQPARIGHAGGSAAIGINRRELKNGRLVLGENPDGPVDRSVDVVRVDSLDAGPLAALLAYACHPVTLHQANLQISADYVGRARAAFEAATGVPLLFVQGACGDINPIGQAHADNTHCTRLGRILAGEALRVYAAIDPRDDRPRLAAAQALIELELRPLPGERRVLPAGWDVRATLDQQFPWAVTIGDRGVRTEVQALAIGDLGIVAAACEPFVETGLAVKAASPFARTCFAGYTNGCAGYVPTAQAFEHRGYEVDVAYLAYRLPAPTAPEAEHDLVRACVDALEQVAAPNAHESAIE